MNKEALEFYLESKNLLSQKIEEKLAEEKEGDTYSKLSLISAAHQEKQANFKENAIKFIKAHPKATENAIVGGLMGGGSELAMPAQYDITGQPSTNMSRIGKRALLGAAMGGVGGEIKSNVRGHISKLAGFSDLLGKMHGMGSSVGNALKSPVGKGALIGSTWGLPVGLNQYETSKRISEGKDLPTSAWDWIENPTTAGLAAGATGMLSGAMSGASIGRILQKNPMYAASLKEHTKKYIPSTLSTKEFLKDPITRNALIGGGAGIVAGLGNGVEESERGKLEFDPSITRTLGYGVTGALSGALLGTQLKNKKSINYMKSITDFVRGSKTKDTTKKLKAGVPGVIAKMKDGTEVLAKNAGIKEVAKNVYNKHPRSMAGGGLALLGGGLGYAGARKKNKKEMAAATAASLGGLGVIGGGYSGAFNQALENSKRLKDLGKAVVNLKTAGMLSPMLQRAGGMIAKNPRAASAVLGAGAGLASNELTGADAPVFSAVAGGALGALGGKQLLHATVNRAKPLLGKDVASGAVNVMKQNRASQLALKPPTSVNMGATQQAAAKMRPVANTQAARTLPVGKGSTNYNTTASSLPSQTSFNPTRVASNKPQTNLPGVSFREGPVASPVMPQKQDPMAGYRPSRSTIPQLAPQRGSMAKSTFDPSLAQTMSKLAHIMKW